MLNVDLYVEGLDRIFYIPEYSDFNRAKMFMEMVSRKKELENTLLNRDSGVIITIGGENTEENMKDCSLITATYCVDGTCVGKLGVVGPTRMKYDEVTSVIEYLTQNLNNAFKLTEGERIMATNDHVSDISREEELKDAEELQRVSGGFGKGRKKRYRSSERDRGGCPGGRFFHKGRAGRGKRRRRY